MKGTGEVEEEPIPVPLGLHLASLFLWLVIVGLVIMVLGLTLFTVCLLFAAATSADPYPEGVVSSLIAVGAEAVFIGMLSGAIWLVTLLEGRPTGRSPGHPGRKIGLAMVGTLVVAGSIALLCWAPSIFMHGVFGTFPWPLVWGCVGGGAFRLYLHLDRLLPE
ncbi:MAG TPA: hypothetical protein VGE67_14310 [Haloferula sp.]